MSVMGDMQALVMELKNLVEQCLASERAVQVLKLIKYVTHFEYVTPYPNPTCTREEFSSDSK